MIGPFLFNEMNSNGTVYLYLFENYYVFLILTTLKMYIIGLYLKQYGVLSHYKECVYETFDKKFQHRWTGKGGPIAWPSWSPDLTTCKPFLGYTKDFISVIRSLKLEWFKSNNHLHKEILTNAWAKVDHRLYVCVETSTIQLWSSLFM